MKLIDEHKIEEILRNLWKEDDGHNTEHRICYNKALQDVLYKLDTIEVKDVDLDKYYIDFLQREWFGKPGSRTISEMMAFTAKHFFELGLQVNNPITAADKGTAEEIIINLKRVEQDYCIDLTKEIKWIRNRVQKGE